MIPGCSTFHSRPPKFLNPLSLIRTLYLLDRYRVGSDGSSDLRTFLSAHERNFHT